MGVLNQNGQINVWNQCGNIKNNDILMFNNVQWRKTYLIQRDKSNTNHYWGFLPQQQQNDHHQIGHCQVQVVRRIKVQRLTTKTLLLSDIPEWRPHRFVSLHQLTNGLIRNVKTLNWKIERILRKFHTSGWSQSQSQQVFCRFSVCLFFCKSIFLSLSALSSLVFIHRGSIG